MLWIGPCNGFSMVAISVMKAAFGIGGLQCYNHMSRFPLWADYKHDITRTYLANIL